MCRIKIATLLASLALSTVSMTIGADSKQPRVLRVGAHAQDITPTHLPCFVSGGYFNAKAEKVYHRIYSRSLVIDDGSGPIVIATMDNTGAFRPLFDETKRLVTKATGIPAERISISSTHTHSGPAARAATRGLDPDPNYVEEAPGMMAEGIIRAYEKMQPARIGWAKTDAAGLTFCRRWIARSDRKPSNPFGGHDFARMHPGKAATDDYIGPCGPVDSELSVLAFQTADGRPLAMMMNYSQHYYGAPKLSSDYQGRVCTFMEERLGKEEFDPPFVGLFTQGTSGDLSRHDYHGKHGDFGGLDKYSNLLVDHAMKAYKTIKFHDWVPVSMAERRIEIPYRVPTPEELVWAKATVAEMGPRPHNVSQVHADEITLLGTAETPEMIFQAIRLGDVGITTMPFEVYGLTGLKLKAQSPLPCTFNVSLANGDRGYLPPPEQHPLGGYTTWIRRMSMGPTVEPLTVETELQLLEKVAGEKRKTPAESDGPYAKTVLQSKPLAYYRLGELDGNVALDRTGNGYNATVEPMTVHYLPGPDGPGFCQPGVVNRCLHFVAGRLTVDLPKLDNDYTVEMWFFNGLPNDARSVTCYLFSRGPEGDEDASGDNVGISGKSNESPGLVGLYNGDKVKTSLRAGPVIEKKTWHYLAFVRRGEQIELYLDGSTEPIVSGTAQATFPAGCTRFCFGGRSDKFANLEGKLDEIAVYDRALPADEIQEHYRQTDGKLAR